MGVPKFFRYISERYPCLSELIRKGQLPEFDNLYLDMNGIIHTCTHSFDEDVHFRMTDEQMFREIFQYVETLFRLIRPNKLFFIAVDGVAPRAKMNQQRGRRFRSAREAEKRREKANEAGEELPDTEQFDSNCITPGTEFMIRLQEALRYFIKQKLSTSSMWQKCRVILSGHETPGEGEHKIMDYIRYLKSQPDYNSNTRHCLYGLDADLIMLGICTHESHFSLLREEVKFGAKNVNEITSIETTRFFLLHIGLLREYLELEFNDAKKALQKITEFTFDIEKILDDWVLMSFLIGNDFIPHLPNMHITSNALPLLYSTYILVLPKIGYINESGILNLSRFELYMKELANNDIMLYQTNIQTNVTNDNDDKKIGSTEKTDEMSSSKTYANDVSCNDEDVAGNGEYDVAFEDKFEAHKRAYYINKLKYREVTEEVLAAQTECYIRAIQWTLQYYYYGCPSWEWYYPHHYAPFISDIKNFKYLDIKFEIGQPFLPYQQLLAVLPVASKDLLPLAYGKLMTSKKSPIHHFYPETYEIDLNGKKLSWEALVLIPFIDEKLLIDAMDKVTLNLSDEERKRNRHKPMLQYDYCELDQGSFEIPNYEKLEEVYCTEIRVSREEISIPKNRFVLGAMETTLHDIYFPGFPTFKYLQYTGTLNNVGVRVFESKSRNETLVITVETKSKYNNLEEAANDLIGKEIFVNWPHLVPAIVVAVSDENWIINRDKTKCQMDPIEFEAQKNESWEHYMFRLGIDLNPDKKCSIHFLIHVNLLIGHTYVYGSYGRMSLEKQWSNNFTITYPDNIIVKDITAYNQNFTLYKSVEEVFSVNSTVFLLNKPDYGSPAQVIDSASYDKCRRIKVHLHRTPQPNFNEAFFLHENSQNNYMDANTAAAKCGIGRNLFVRITGSIFVVPRKPATSNEKVDIGLQLKFSKKNLEIPGYTKRKNNIWLYSDKVCMIVRDYYNRYPKIFKLINKQSKNSFMDIYYESNLDVDENQTNLLHQMVDYLKNQKCAEIVGRTCDAKTLETETLQSIVKAVDKMNALKQDQGDIIELLVKPNKLYKSNLNCAECSPDEKAVHNLFDRIIIVKEDFTVPLGSTGTIISISEDSDTTSVRKDSVNFIQLLYVVLFDKPFPGGLSIANRAFSIRHNVFLNITYGTGKKCNNNSENNSENSYMCQQTVAGHKEKQKETIPLKNIWNKLKFSSEESSSCRNNVGPLYPEFLQQKQQRPFDKQTPLHQLQRQEPLLTQPKVKDISEEAQNLSVNNSNADEEEQLQLVYHKEQLDLQSTISEATNVMVKQEPSEMMDNDNTHDDEKEQFKLVRSKKQVKTQQSAKATKAGGHNIILPKNNVNNKSKAIKPQKLTATSKQPAATLASKSQKKNKDTEIISSSIEQLQLENSLNSNNKKNKKKP